MPSTLETFQSIQASSTLGQDVFTIVSGLLIAGAGSALWIRKKLSKDSLDIKRDSAESELIQHLEDERDVIKADKDKIHERLLIVEQERNAAVSAVGKLSVEVEHLKTQVVTLERLITEFSKKLDFSTTKMQEYAIENAKLGERILHMQESQTAYFKSE